MVQGPPGSLISLGCRVTHCGRQDLGDEGTTPPFIDSPFPPPPPQNPTLSTSLTHHACEDFSFKDRRFSQRSKSVVLVPSYSVINFARSTLDYLGSVVDVDGRRRGVCSRKFLERFVKDGTVDEKTGLQAWIGSRATKKMIEGGSTAGEDALLSKVKV